MLTKLLVATALATGLVVTPAAADPGPDTVRTVEGAVRGTVAADHRKFQGIPFAAPPVGDLRWRSPQKVTLGSGVRDATAPGPRCVYGNNTVGSWVAVYACLPRSQLFVHATESFVPFRCTKITTAGHVRARLDPPISAPCA